MKTQAVGDLALPAIPLIFSRCATTDANAADVIAAGAIPGVVMGLQVYEESSAFVAGAVKALTSLATSEANTEEVNQQGGVTQVVRAMEAKPEYAQVAVRCFCLFPRQYVFVVFAERLTPPSSLQAF